MTIANQGQSPVRKRQRGIGPLGTAARAGVGTWLLVLAFQAGIRPIDVVLGLVVANGIVFAVLAARGADAPPLRMTGPVAHVANFGIGIAVLNFGGVPGLLFVGSAALLAAARGYSGCEMFAVWNWLRRRDDQFACPYFICCDIVDEAITGRGRAC